MDTFRWSHLFETGLEEIDSQHRRLVTLLNQLGRDSESATPEQVDIALGELAQYAVYHFDCEERVMAAEGVSKRHATRHQETHRRFVKQVSNWLEQRKRDESLGLGQLLDFLANWLVFHILGEDQALGRQVKAIRTGIGCEAVFDQDRASDDPRTDILLGAIQRLYGGLVARNEELLASQRSLAALNTSLEQRVMERTAELVEANHRLREEQERLLEAEKMASLGRMVAGFAHEVNTPIGIAVGAASQSREIVGELTALLGQEEVSEEDISTRLSVLDQASSLALNNLSKAAGMVRSFKRTAVDQSSEADRDFALSEVIEDVLASLRNDLKNTPITIQVDCPDEIQLYGSAGALEQVLTNLVLNSRMHAFSDGTREGIVRIKAGWDEMRVWIEFSDDGCGMNADTVQHIFEPFYTTRRGSGGSGLGLYLAYNTVSQGLGGTILCRSALGAGTVFQIECPRNSFMRKEDKS
jgi:hemerythrin-like metal-binding protein